MQLPNNLAAEESLIGSMLLSATAIGVAVESKVKKNDFYEPNLGILFDEILAIYEKEGMVDEIVLLDALEKKNLVDKIGGRQRLYEIQGGTISSFNAESYAKIVLEQSQLRQLAGVADQIKGLVSGSDEVRSILDEAEQLLFNVAERKASKTLSDAKTSILRAIEHHSSVRATGVPPGLTTGFTGVDSKLLGLQPGSLYVIAARPGLGKSSLALNMALNIAKRNIGVAFFSLEMPTLELINRLLAGATKLPFQKIQTGQTNDEEFKILGDVGEQLSEFPLFIDDDAQCSVMELRAKARRLKTRHNIGVIFVDYLQLMDVPKSENRQVAVAGLSRGLKILAKELDVPVVCLAQLNRQVEYRADKRPTLADLKESGAIEADSDAVMFLYRDEVYEPNTEDKGLAEVIISKNRRGSTGTVKLAFISEQVRFDNIATW